MFVLSKDTEKLCGDQVQILQEEIAEENRWPKRKTSEYLLSNKLKKFLFKYGT
jgi:hypothetical protein